MRLLILFILYALFSCALVVIYVHQLAPANVLNGWHPWAMNAEGWGALIVGWFAGFYCLSRIGGQPSDFLRLFICTIPLTSFLLLHSVAGELPDGAVFANLCILMFPLLLLSVASRWDWMSFRLPSMPKSLPAEYVALALLLIVVLVAYFHAPEHAGFGINDTYVRRFEGRELYPARTVLAYALSMSMNGLVPFLAYRATERGKSALLVIALGAVVFFYWLIGVKAPFAYVLAASAMGLMIRSGKLKYIGHFFLLAVVLAALVVVGEWLLISKYSYVADYFFRRLFPIQALDQSYYLQFLFSDKPVEWSWIVGSSDPSFQPSYFIGEHFGGNPQSNSNTNAFLASLMSGGAWGYAVAVAFIVVVLSLYDRLWTASKNPAYLFLGYMYSALLIEQAYSVAMVSSGVMLLTLLVMLEKPGAVKRSEALPMEVKV
jgi:hypothetical protein